MSNTQINQNLTAALSRFFNRLQTAVDDRVIKHMYIDPVNGELIVEFKDGSETNLGNIMGADGDPGVSILDVQLYEDPDMPGDVFIQTTLSNGVILRTQESLKGWDGRGIANAYVYNNHFHFVLDDIEGTELPPIPVDGLKAISITAGKIENGDLVFDMSDGSTINAGVANNLAGNGIDRVWIDGQNLKVTLSYAPSTEINLGKVVGDSIQSTKIVDGELVFVLSTGREIIAGAVEGLAGVGVTDVKIENGRVLIKYTNTPGYQDLGALDGVANLAVKEGKLVYSKSSAPDVDIVLSEYKYFTGMQLVGNELFVLTNQPAPNDRINLGPVENLKGDIGIGVKGVDLANNTLTFTLTDDSTLAVPISGLDPVAIVGARYDSVLDEVFFILEDGSEISSGIKEDLRGESLVKLEVTELGVLQAFYERDPTTPIVISTIKFIKDLKVTNGKLYVYYNTEPTTAVELTTIQGIKSIFNDSSKITVEYLDGTKTILGEMRGIEKVEKDEDFNLIVTFDDGTSANLGKIQGIDGQPGDSIETVSVTEAGDLIVELTSGESLNAGQVRADVDNILGSIKRFIATAGQTEYAVLHSGEAAVFVNGLLLEPDDIDLGSSESIVFVTPLSAGDVVVVMAFAPIGHVITSKGLNEVKEVSPGVYELTLENNTKFTIDTVTPIDPEALPPKITGMEIDINSHLIIDFSDGSKIDAGYTANANSIETAKVNEDGDLILTLSDDSTVNCGSVMSNLAITDCEINAQGELIITMNSGGSFNAGPTGAYVTNARIDVATGKLLITLNTGTVIDAGVVVNPIFGTTYDFTAFEGQTEFELMHEGHKVLLFANGILLSSARLDLTDPTKVKVLTPRKADDIVKIVLMSTGGVYVKGLEAEAAAIDNTFYGKVGGQVGFHSMGTVKVATPFDFVASPGQTVFLNIPHNNVVDVYVNGLLKTKGFVLTPTRVTFDVPFVGGEEVRITPLTAPKPLNNFVVGNYCKVANKTYQNGGTFSAKVWQGRQLNTMEHNALGAILDKNQLILPAGYYYVRGWAMCVSVTANTLRLYSNTSRKTLLATDAQYSSGPTKTLIEGYFELTTQSAVVLQHYGLKAVATIGLGQCGDGSSSASKAQVDMGVPIVHSELHVWKVG